MAVQVVAPHLSERRVIRNGRTAVPRVSAAVGRPRVGAREVAVRGIGIAPRLAPVARSVVGGPEEGGEED
eukprot:scaffold224925_cov30-Tisochrysis_lutea.AAC.1